MGHGFFAMFTQGPKGIFQWSTSSTSSTSTFNRWSRGFSGRHGKAPGTGSRRLVTLAEAQSRPWQPVGPKGPRDGGKPMAFPWKMIPMLANSQPKQWFLNWTYTKKGFRVSGKVLLCPSLEVKMKVSSAPMFVSSRKLMVEYGWTMMNLHTIKIQ